MIPITLIPINLPILSIPTLGPLTYTLQPDLIPITHPPSAALEAEIMRLPQVLLALPTCSHL